MKQMTLLNFRLAINNVALARTALERIVFTTPLDFGKSKEAFNRLDNAISDLNDVLRELTEKEMPAK